MSKAWIEELAGNIKEKDREVANAYGREQHRLGVVSAKGAGFFTALVLELEEDFREMKAALQGDATASETAIESNGLDRVTMTRSRFPWFDAVLKYDRTSLRLEYAQGKGVIGDPKVATGERQVVVGPDDGLLVEEGLGVSPRRFERPEELAKHIVERLFAV